MFVLAEGTAPVVDPGTATGVFSLLWLVIALPALGALILLVGGPLAKALFQVLEPFGGFGAGRLFFSGSGVELSVSLAQPG